MVKHLTMVGNSAALVIDKPILQLLRITMKTPLEVTTDGQSLIISPVKNEARVKRFKEATMRVLEQHDETFRRLAK